VSDHATTVAASRGVLGAGYTVLTPANRYASRLPNLRDGLLYKLVTPRLAPARFGEYVVALDAGGTLTPVAPGFEDFLYVLEVHDEEHGLYMTAGAGSYHLAGAQHEVREHDFVYMAPYCPQSFVATGDAPAEYLLYKDVYRDGF
jgi:glyoxylate utilization-related uncharacterized protein